MHAVKINNIARIIALASFVIGTLLFVSFSISHHEYMFMVGLYYVMGAILINSVALLALFCNFYLCPSLNSKTLVSIGMVLANIPIALCYFYVVINILM